MKLLFSVPTGYHLRELLLPLKPRLIENQNIQQVIIATPAQEASQDVFPAWPAKFTFVKNPDSLVNHQDMMRRYQPNLVITNTVGHDEKDYPILVAAKKESIPTLTFIASWDNVWKIERLLKTPSRVALADTFVVWNTMMKDHLRRLLPSIDENSIHIIGAPRLDYYAQKNLIPSKAQLFTASGLSDPSRPLIHFSTTELYPMDYIVKAVRQAQETHKLPKNLALLATVHPGGKLENHAHLEKYGVHVRFAFGRHPNAAHPAFTYNPSEADIFNAVALYCHSNVLVNHSSTTALESLLADVPVINVKYGAPLDWWRWYRSMVYRDFAQHYDDVVNEGATAVVKNASQLIHAIDSYLKNPAQNSANRKQTIKKMITTTDGTASRQVLDLIAALAQ
ncbi:MAG: CDP-glycerol glycerophosphotransferase family protein [Candidatus Andersenbacteria bacterium]|nr:CDP-glycerol glycerophosphotransferase family protein [Candidatus Andersenbacteria bacterium]